MASRAGADGGAVTDVRCPVDRCGPRCARAGRRGGPATLVVLDAPSRSATTEAPGALTRPAGAVRADAFPVLVCLNRGWGGERLLRAGIRWARSVGRPLSAVYVLTASRPRRRHIRAANRALRDARAIAERADRGAGLLMICACDVAAGLDAAAAATAGEVLLWSGDHSRSVALAVTGVPYRELPMGAV